MKKSYTKKVSPKRRQQMRHEGVLRTQCLERCRGLCEQCGQPPDWRGLSLSHTKPKGMGGTTHEYTIEEVQLLCGRCHNERHGIVEI